MLHWSFTFCRRCKPKLTDVVKKTFNYGNSVVWNCQASNARRLLSVSSSTSNNEILFSNDKFQEYLGSMMKEYLHDLKAFNEAAINDDKKTLKSLTDKILRLKPITECIELVDKKKQEILELDKLISGKKTRKLILSVQIKAV